MGPERARRTLSPTCGTRIDRVRTLTALLPSRVRVCSTMSTTASSLCRCIVDLSRLMVVRVSPCSTTSAVLMVFAMRQSLRLTVVPGETTKSFLSFS